MNVNEFLSPLIQVNPEVYCKMGPNQGESQRSLISARLRLMLSTALKAKKFCYVARRENI